jgi:hypothetical protein
MKNIIYNELLKRTSNEKINFLKDVNKQIIVDKRGKFEYFYMKSMGVGNIKFFLAKLDVTSFYTVIPVISIFGINDDPHVILSRQILISAHSNPNVINEYLNSQLEKAVLDFEVNLDNKHYYLIFKYKKIGII